jgi:ribosomal protein S18 acetylase RimI-like enzyme
MAEVRIAVADDVPEVAAVLASGFWDDPVMAWVFEEAGREAKLTALFGYSMTSRFVPDGRTYVTDDAAAGWLPPGKALMGEGDGDESEFANRLLAAGASLDELLRLGAMGAAMDAAHPTESHWYLAMIAARRDRQGQGLGTLLMQQALEVVDEQRQPAYLESSNPRNITLYERHGFVVTGTIEIPDGPSLTPMWREAR